MSKGKGRVRCRCGGGPTHHTLEPQCWCDSCLKLPEADRCIELVPIAVVSAPPKKFKNLPRKGTKAYTILNLIGVRRGLTDDELEYLTGWSHQTVSAARNKLMNDGLIADTGFKRPTRSSGEATVWERR